MPARIILSSASIAALAGLGVPQSASAQDDAEGQAEIVVIGEGLEQTPSITAYAVSELARDTIVTAPSGRIEEVLGSVAGFQQFRRSDSRSANPSAQGVTLRALGGNASSRALILLDGVPMTDPFFGYVPFSAIAPERLGTIRVTRGGGSGPFGAGALTGTIELESAAISGDDPLRATVLANSRGESETSASVATRLGGGFVEIGGRWDRGQGFYTTPQAQRVPASARAAFDSWSLALRGVAPLGDDLELQARGLAFDDARTLRFAGADSTSTGQDASLRLVGKGRWQFDALAYVQARNFSNVVISSTQFTRVLDQRNTPSTGIGGKLELRPPVGGGHVLRLGLDYRRASGELREDAYSAFTGARTETRQAGGVTSDLGLFVEDDWTLGALVLTGGVRADATRIADGFYRARTPQGVLVSEIVSPDRSDWTVSWRAGAAYALMPGLRLRAAAYTGLRLPTLNELYRPFVVFPVVTQANAALANERLEGFEAGVEWMPVQGVELSLTAFDNRVEDAIANVTIAPNLRERRNLPAISARGVEADFSAKLGQFTLAASLSFTDAAVVGEGASLALDGNRPPQVPRWLAAASAFWRPADGWLIGASLRHVGRQFEDDLEMDALSATTVLGGFAQLPVAGKWSLVLRAENLTDARVVTRNDGGSIDLGAPRTLWAGVRYGF